MLKTVIRIMKRLLHEDISSNPKCAVEHYRKKGVTIGENTELYNTAIDNIRPFLVTIGSNVLITGSRILTHDASTKKFIGYTKIGRVRIGDNVFIGVNSIVLPNVTIGNNVIVGAGTVVAKDIPDNSVVVGNPMRIVGTVSDNIKKNEDLLETCPKFEQNYNMTDWQKDDMKSKLGAMIGFVKCED